MKIIQILLKANFTNTYLIYTDITWHTLILFLCYWIIKMTYTILLSNTIYILLNYKYATTYFYYLYYVTTFTTCFLPTLLLLFTSLTRTFISAIFSLYIFPIYTMCIAYLYLTQLSYTYYNNYYLDYLFILKNELFTILILLYYANNTYTHLRTM